MSLTAQDLLYSTGLNIPQNSLGFLIKNQTVPADTSTYIVFPAHCLPQQSVVIQFLFQNVKRGSTRVDRTVFFKVIGLDNLLDLAVAVFDNTLPGNEGIELDTAVVQIQPNTDTLTSATVLLYTNNNADLRVKTVKTTTVQNSAFNGPNDIVQFFYPKCLLLQQETMVGCSGAPVVDQDLKCYGMIWADVSSVSKAQPVAIHCQLLYSAIFDNILPRYLVEVAKAIQFPDDPNILNDVDYVADYISKGVPKSFLGFLGIYSNVTLLDNEMFQELKGLKNVDGFLIMKFYHQYNLVNNMFDLGTYVKTPFDNNKIRIYTPFNPQTGPLTFLYRHIMSAGFTVRAVLLKTIQYTRRNGESVELSLGTSPGADDSLSIFMYDSDPLAGFTVRYWWFGKTPTSNRSTWNYEVEDVQPSDVLYKVNAQEVETKTTQFPSFILGNEVPGNSFNLDASLQPYTAPLLRPQGRDRGERIINHTPTISGGSLLRAPMMLGSRIIP